MHQLVNKQNFDNIKMHGTNVKITGQNIANCYSVILIVLLLHEIGLYEYGDLHRASIPVYFLRNNMVLKGLYHPLAEDKGHLAKSSHLSSINI